ncbi:VOC family protein [Streptomyces sp. NPDC049954]|uniref:VOC family protein n=1 Tax=Streptomyces sp. NPDC049954 TaxID=3155779 RepID=UPI0034179431
MSVRRIVPVLPSSSLPQSRAFYELLGLEQVMDHGWIATFAEPERPSVQLSAMTQDRTAPVSPDVSIEVDDVEAAYETMRESGAEILVPLRDEEWGVRRFFVREPGGKVVNVLGHRA